MMTNTIEAETWTNTTHKIVRCTHAWTIRNFNYYLDSNENEFPKIKSSKFSPIDDPDGKYKFYLSLFPKGENKENQNNVSVFLYLRSCEKPDETRIKYQVSIINQKKTKYKTRVALRKITLGKGCGWPEFITHKELQNKMLGLLPNNTLTIFCEIEAIVDSIQTSGITSGTSNNQIESKILDNLSRLLESEKHCDLMLVSANQTELRAHKAILVAQSEVFAAMFEHDTKESREHRVVIEDIEANVIQEMLRFIYTGKVQNLDLLADQLLVAADKYGLDQLKVVCENFILSTINSDTVIDMLVLADKHCAKQLRTKAIEFINANLSAIMQTDNWKAIEDKPKLYFELFSKMLTEKVVKY